LRNHATTVSARLGDIVDEGVRLVARAEEAAVSLRLLGGIGVALTCPDAMSRPGLAREYHDIDLAVSRRGAKATRDLLSAEGYEANSHFNAVNAMARLLFYDLDNERQVDVFVGTFEMCHKLPLEPRLSGPGPALSPSDLLLLKLQIVQVNEKDVQDALALLLQYEPSSEDRPNTLSSAYISQLCARDWGWYTTLRDNLGAVRDWAPQTLKQSEEILLVQARIDSLITAIDSAPKSMNWRLRDKVGRRVAWYELPEEVER
jgi:hypothetical protein